MLESDVKSFISSKINKSSRDKRNSTKKRLKVNFYIQILEKLKLKDIPRVKKLASTYLLNSWTTIPHVTNHDEADITEMEEF